MMQRILFALSAAAALSLPTAALADRDDAYRGEHRIEGRVIAFEPYNLQLDRGPHIILHRGTVIHPTGTTLRHGMPVRVLGHVTEDGRFSADEIDLLPPLQAPYRRY